MDLLAVQGTLKSLFQHHSLKASILWHSAFFMVQLSHLYKTTENTIALTIQTFVGKEMSLLFNMLSRFVIAFFPRSKHLNFTGALTIHRDFGVQENTETQTLVKVNLSTILDLFCSKQFMSCPGAVILLKYVPCLLPSCFKSRKSWREDPEGRVGRHLSTHTWRHPDDQLKQ